MPLKQGKSCQTHLNSYLTLLNKDAMFNQGSAVLLCLSLSNKTHFKVRDGMIFLSYSQ